MTKKRGIGANRHPLGQYLTRWNAWFHGGLCGIKLRGAFLPALEACYTGQAGKKKQAASG